MKNISTQKLNRIIYSIWDLQQALSFLTFLIEDCDFQKKYSKLEIRRFKCYETSFIISFSRPFQQSRGKTTLGLKELGVQLSQSEIDLQEKLLGFRKTIIAHSDDDEMHFKSSTFCITDDHRKFQFPNLTFDESLLLSESEIFQCADLTKRLLTNLCRFIFHIAQESPELLEKYKSPLRHETN